ncbi:protein translocase subunit SecD [bacterium]|nr:protein translocase subunit SecD [bacterium]
MNSSNKFRSIVCILVTLAGFYLVLPTLWGLYHPDTEEMPEFLPNTSMQLGLDLKGGVHMVLGVDLDQVVLDQLQNYGTSLESSLTKAGISGVTTKVLSKNFELEITAPDVEVREKVAGEISENFTALEFVGESENILVTRMPREQDVFVRQRAIEQSIKTIRNRIDEFGVAEPIITRKGDSQILVQFPGAKDPERLKSLIGQTAQLQFRIVHECTDGACQAEWSTKVAAMISDVEQKGGYNRESFPRLSEYRDRVNVDLAGQLPPDTEVFFERKSDSNVVGRFDLIPYLLSTKNSLSGEYIRNAWSQLSQDSMTGPQEPMVYFQMNPVGAPMLEKMTTDYKMHFMAIVLDDIVKSAPQIQGTISTDGQIKLGTGSFDEIQAEAADTAIVLRAGALPAKIEIQEERVIGPSIGRDAIEAGKKALILSCVFILAFMWLYYGMSGVLANIVTLVNVGLIFAILGSVKATLTLPGIAGIVLTLGMAVDALIIIFERMREELKAGNSTKKVMELGFGKAFWTIFDSNVTTLIGAVILLNYGTGSIRGFAFTLIVGITVNVFMATYYAKTLFGYYYGSGRSLKVGLSERSIAREGRV